MTDISGLIRLERQGKLPEKAASLLLRAREKGLIKGNELTKAQPIEQPAQETPTFFGEPQPGPDTDIQVPGGVLPQADLSVLSRLPKPSLFQQIGGRGLVEDVGGTIGGFAGGALTKTPQGAVLGGGLGGAAATNILDLVTGQTSRKPGLLGVIEDLQKAGGAGTKQAAFEAAGPIVSNIAGGTVRGAGRLLGVRTPEARILAKEAIEAKIPLGAIDVSEKQFVKGSAKVLGVMPFVGGPLRKSKEGIATALAKKSEIILDELGPNVDLTELGVNTVKAAKRTNQAFKRLSTEFYKNFESLASTEDIIPTQGVRDSAQKLINEFIEDAPVLNNGKLLDIAKDHEIMNRLGDLTKLGDNINIKEFRSIQRQLNRLMSSETGIGFRQLKTVKGALEGSLNSINPETAGADVVSALKVANKFYANGIKTFETATAKKLNRVEKNLFGASVFKPGTAEAEELIRLMQRTRSPTAISNFRDLVGDDTFKQFRRDWFEQAFTRAEVRVPVGEQIINEISPVSLAKELGLRGTKVENSVMKALLDGSTVTPERIDRFLRLMEKSEAKFVPNPSTFLTRRIVLAGPKSLARLAGFTGGAAAGTAASAIPAIGPIKVGAFFLTGRQFAKMLSSPKALSAMQASFKNPPRSSQAWKAQALRIIDTMPEEFEETQ